MTEHDLEFRHVSKEFHDRHGGTIPILTDISFTLRPNQFTTLVGPSGCGKSTLLRLAVGLEQATTGAVYCKGRPIVGPHAEIGYITQDANLYPWYTLRQNVELPLIIRQVPKEVRQQRVVEYLEMAGLTGSEDRYPSQLSGGMQKRASIIRTLIYHPSLVLMDEPFGSLDAQTKMVMQDYLLKIWQQQNTTVLFITHDLHEAVILADNVVLLTGAPTRVKSDVPVHLPRPRNVFEPYEMEGFVECYQHIWTTFKAEIAE